MSDSDERSNRRTPTETSPETFVLLRFLLLFSVLYAAFGVASPFLPAFLSSRGLAPEQIGVVVALGTTIRLVSGPAAARVADRLHALRIVLSACTVVAGLAAFWLVPATGFLMLLTVSLLHAAMLAPTTVLADALALGASRPGQSSTQLEYGWVRGMGSATFIIGSLAAGQAVGVFDVSAVLLAQAVLLVAAAVVALFVPELLVRRHEPNVVAGKAGSILDLVRIPAFCFLVLLSALILGSHAMHDSFAMISWQAAGISSSTGSVLWSESVAAEVVVFFALGPFLLRCIALESAMAIAALAAVVRWAVLAQTSDIAVPALVQPLHGLTFALLHLSCMRMMTTIVPRALAATAQAIYAVGNGASSVVLTLLSGSLYGQFGRGGFLAMAAFAGGALPVIWALSRTRPS